MGNLVFNSISTVDMGVQIQTPPVYEFPRRIYDTIKIEGRDGDLVIDRESYENVERRYFLALGFRKGSTFLTNAKMIVEWLNSVKGYARLEDSYEPDYYRMALFNNPGEMTNYYDQATSIEIAFNCKPQRFLKTGEIPKKITTLNTVIQIVNPTNTIALPKIVLDGDNLEIQLASKNESSITKTSFKAEHTIDSDLQDAFSINGFVNNSITLTNGFPKLYPGLNEIRVRGNNLRKFEITPRWWTL